MRNSEQYDSNTRLVIDDTTIYEIDMECYQCLSERDKEKYFGTEDKVRGKEAAENRIFQKER